MEEVDFNAQVHAANTDQLVEPTSSHSTGPLFDEIYAGVIDLQDKEQVLLSGDCGSRPLLDNTTDISSLSQFLALHSVPQRLGTLYKHIALANGIASFGKN